MELYAIVDATLFWPADGSTPAWPNLEELAVAFHPAVPSGSWYFHGPRYEGASDGKGFAISEGSYPLLEASDTDKTWDDLVQMNGAPEDGESTSNKFRINPDNETITPLLESFARAAATMYRLKRAVLWSPLEWRAYDMPGFRDTYTAEEISKWKWGKPAWGVAYAKPGEVAFCDKPGEDSSSTRQLWWAVGRWRPSDGCQRLFQKIGGSKTELLEYWEFEHYGNDLVERAVFEES